MATTTTNRTANMTTTIPTDESDPTYTHFTHRTEFIHLLDKFLTRRVDAKSVDKEDEQEDGWVREMGAILDHYLPLPPLLDPSLQDIIPPLLLILSTHLAILYDGRGKVEQPYTNVERLARIGRLVGWVGKVRGRKGILPYFPPEIQYLPILICILSPTATTPFHPVISDATSWELRSILLTWLSLLLTVPFNLSAFDEPLATAQVRRALPSHLTVPREPFPKLASGSTIHRLLHLLIPLLDSPSSEGSTAALVLARLFARGDGVDMLEEFFNWVGREVDGIEGRENGILLTNISTLLAILPSLLPSPLINLPIIQTFLHSTLYPQISPSLPADTTSVQGKSARTENGLLRKMSVKVGGRWWVCWLLANGFRERIVRGKENDNVLQKLGNAEVDEEEEEEKDLPDGIEEEIESLMDSLSDKDTIVRYSAAKYLSRISILLPRSLSSQIVSATIERFANGSDEDGIGSEASSRWHGCCLALAEMARRGLVGEMVKEVLPWAMKALVFDVRRGAHSIGSNVRDAAAYLLWSLARAGSPSDIAPFANEIATQLVAVACYDREVSIRRAASAAFQEHVGRMGLFPHGIDVLRKTDFYSVSVRRTAFLVAAPQVAEHEEYRPPLLDYLHSRTLRHWDVAIREIGAQSLRSLCSTIELARAAVHEELRHLPSLDSNNVHGALVALTELANGYRQANGGDVMLAEMMSGLLSVRPTTFTSFGADLSLEATCNLIAAAACSESLTDLSLKVCQRVLELSMKSRREEVQTAAARAIGAIRSRTGRPAQKQSYARAIGCINIPPAMLQLAVDCLMRNLIAEGKADVETRQASLRSLAAIACNLPNVQSKTFAAIVKIHLESLNDYSTDQRGDVGSWIRTASIDGLADLSEHGEIDLSDVVDDILKQGVEKLDNVREIAGRALRKIAKKNRLDWLQDVVEESIRWNDPSSLYPVIMPLLRSSHISPKVLEGLLISIGSKNQHTSQVSTTAFIRVLREMSAYELSKTISMINSIASGNMNQNRVFLPILNALAGVGRSGLFSKIDDSSLRRMIFLVSRGVGTMKNVERITGGMKVVSYCLVVEGLRSDVCASMNAFLGHAYPRVRAVTAEQLYLVTQDAGWEDEDLDEGLLSVEWTSNDALGKVKDVIDRLTVVGLTTA